MKRFLALLLIVPMLGAAALLTSRTDADKTILSWTMSTAARAVHASLAAENSKTWFEQENFDAVFAALYGRERQIFPVESTHTPLSREHYGEQDVYVMTPNTYGSIVLYLHGGAYTYEMEKAHADYCDLLANKLQAKVYMPLYPLTPDHTYEETYALLSSLYSDIVKQGLPVYIMGDSAGGGLALAFTEYLQATERPLPNKLVLFSPWLDVTLSNPAIAEYAERDSTLAVYGAAMCGTAWAGSTDPTDYRISPLYGTLQDLPDMLVFTGTDEILYPDIRTLYHRLSGTDITLVVGSGYWHVFPLYSIPERAESLSLIASFVNS